MPGLIFDTRAKERLTGALIIVIAAVVGVPEVFSGPAQTPRPAAEVSSLARPIHPVADPSLPDLPRVPSPQSSSPPEPATAPRTAGTAPRVPARTLPEDTAPAPAAVTPPAPSLPPAVRLARADASAAPRGSTAALSAAPIADDPGAVPPDAPPATDARIWSVQLGSFESPGIARQMGARLAGEGFQTYVSASLVTGQLLYRVRTVPATDRARAEILAQRLAAAGHDVSVQPR